MEPGDLWFLPERMAITASSAWWFLPFVLPVCLYVCFTDLREMRITNQAVLVLGQEARVLSIYDPTAQDSRAEVSLEEFLPVFGGTVLRAEARLTTLSETHAGLEAKAHWFWGRFAQFRRHFLEVALGSFVANRLAVAAPATPVRTALAQLPVRQDPDALTVPDHL